MIRTNTIKVRLAAARENGEYVIDKTGVKTIELLGVSFIADEPTIFGKVSGDYVERELDWYLSQSLNVNDIPEPVPAIWKAVADDYGFINSNYGWAILSADNGSQFDHCVAHLKENPDTRRACMIYTRPSMHTEYKSYGKNDFMCTHAVNYLARNGKLNAVVQMRSNDAVFGYKNDWAWQKYVLENLADATNLQVGDIIWNAASLHVYERHFNLVDDFIWEQNT